jgi:hypothetical protein
VKGVDRVITDRKISDLCIIYQLKKKKERKKENERDTGFSFFFCGPVLQ